VLDVLLSVKPVQAGRNRASGGTLSENFLAGRMPYRKLFALAGG
jgi:hypothetical protein